MYQLMMTKRLFYLNNETEQKLFNKNKWKCIIVHKAGVSAKAAPVNRLYRQVAATGKERALRRRKRLTAWICVLFAPVGKQNPRG